MTGLRSAWRRPIPAGLLLVALALVIFGLSQRYSFTHLGGLYVTRADRLTGRIDLCIGHRDGSMACYPATKGARSTGTDSVAP